MFTRLIVASFAFLLAGCGHIPYRTAGFAQPDGLDCGKVYADYDREQLTSDSPSVDLDNRCWKRSLEEHDEYDLLVAEFDDQGWVQGASGLSPDRVDFQSEFLAQLDRLYQARRSRPDEQGLSLVVYVHGWHHDAGAADEDVRSFRRFLRQISQMEGKLAANGYLPMRVVGIYVGWRGESITVPYVNELTFWDRKNAAQRVSQGSVRELLKRLDQFRDSARATDRNKRARNVRMLTIGHSFGGLITFESLSSEFLRYAVRFKETRQDGSVDPWMSRVGDLVVIVNPAFEGTRYEPLRAASQRLKPLERRQLPVLVVATSEGDWATGFFFPLARWVSTILEDQPDAERAANTQAVGHNERYITHDLRTGACAGDCSKACRPTTPSAPAAPSRKIKATVQAEVVDAEYELMRRIEQEGVGATEYLCSGLELKGTARWQPDYNPFWVVRTSAAVIKDHGDIFNPNFIAFMRQMYLGFIFARFRAPG